jgi:hypothetical protein
MQNVKPKVIIVDIDGTFTDCSHRRHFLEGDKPDWKSFNESCVSDTVNEWAKCLIRNMLNDTIPVFVSGRMEEFREITENLLEEHLYLGYEGYQCHLFMRPNGDFRPDIELKKEIYDTYIKDEYDVLLVVDDRPSVCRMWRSLGLTVLQCDDMEF